MPIFEYRCSDCNSTFELLQNNNHNNHVTCPECNSSNNKKLFSSFSTSQNETRYSYNNCTSGNCNIDESTIGGCTRGLCGLN
jgi:putative FmdB family regulatory protein